MARSEKQPTKKGKVKQMPGNSGNIAVEDAAASPETPFDAVQGDEPRPNDTTSPDMAQPARPHQPPPRPKPQNWTFFDKVRQVPKEDWGSRVFMYLYCFEPICNEKISGEKKYLNRYDQPIYDEQSVMVDFGSGKYRLTLTHTKPTDAEKGRPIDTYDFEIYNLKHPPKIPKAVWKNDSRNARWEALLPKDDPKTNGIGVDPMAAFDTFMNIQDRVAERMTPPTPPATTAPPVPPDPFDTAKKIMEMRQNDPMIGALMQRLDAQDKAAEAARQREFELQKELRQQSTGSPSKGLLDQVLELVTAADKLEPVKKFFSGIFGNNNGTGEGIVQTSRRTTGMDILRDFVQSPAAAKIGDGLGTLLTTIATPPMIIPTNALPNTNGATRPQVAGQETDQQRIVRIAQTITGPMLDEYFDEEESGDTFAANMFNFWPADLKFMQGLGAQRILELYRGFPPAWGRIGPKETQFAQFLKELCEWKPDTDEADSNARFRDTGDGIVDLEERSEAASAS